MPPPGYLAGVRALLRPLRHRADPRRGDGRLRPHRRVVRLRRLRRRRPDLITFAKGVNSGYVPVGGVIISDAIAADFDESGLPRRPHLQRPPAGGGLDRRRARRDGERGHRRERRAGSARDVHRSRPGGARREARGDRRGARRGRLLGASSWSPTATTREPVPAAVMGRAKKELLARGLLPFAADNRIHVVPPCVVTDDEVAQAIAIYDDVLDPARRGACSHDRPPIPERDHDRPARPRPLGRRRHGRRHLDPHRRRSTTRRGRRCSKQVRLASAADVDAAVAARHGGVRRRGATRRSPSASTVMFAFRELLNARKRRARRDPHLRARQGPLRRRRRDRPRPRGRRVRLRLPHLIEGRVLRERLDRRRRLLAQAAARRRRHHQPVQLPGDGAAVVLPDRDRRRQHRGAQAQREGPVGGELDGRAAEGGGPARRRPQRRARRQGGRRRAARAPRRRARSRSSARRRSRSTSTRPAPRTASACRRSAARRTTCWCCPTPTSTWPPTPRSTPASARPASAAWRSRSSLAVDAVADELVEKITRADGKLRTGDGRAACDMGPLITREHRDKVAGVHRRRDRRRRRPSSSTAAASRSTATPTASGSAPP